MEVLAYLGFSYFHHLSALDRPFHIEMIPGCTNRNGYKRFQLGSAMKGLLLYFDGKLSICLASLTKFRLIRLIFGKTRSTLVEKRGFVVSHQVLLLLFLSIFLRYRCSMLSRSGQLLGELRNETALLRLFCFN